MTWRDDLAGASGPGKRKPCSFISPEKKRLKGLGRYHGRVSRGKGPEKPSVRSGLASLRA
ncbi:hypothetical protein TSC_c11930 [Thermus scotoductus SA-01]|uniref:Uncharacterized protein n=1 Tax=Thermus scotoductus (strain ATCC 700910 / SA-01) TaxID=743525 RepID=E8PQN1_THESS|nr:hypothetical protein TSC_c11930 [Thermus scotoductus SA-01]